MHLSLSLLQKRSRSIDMMLMNALICVHGWCDFRYLFFGLEASRTSINVCPLSSSQ